MTVPASHTPPLLVSLVKIRQIVNRIARQFDLDHPLMDQIAELQAHLSDAFRGAKELLSRT